MRSVGFEINSVIIVLGLLFSAGYSIILGIYIWVKGSKEKTVIWLLSCQGLLTMWTVLHLFELLAPTLEVRWVVVAITYFPVCYFAAAFYMFARSYSNKVVRGYPVVIAVFALPTMMYFGFLTNPFHQLFYKEFFIDGEVYGIFIYLIFIMDIIYVVFAAVQLSFSAAQKSIYKKQQTIFAILSILVPFAVHFLFIMRFVDLGFNITLIALPISYTIITVAVMKYQFLDIMPLTLSEAVETIDDGFLVVNMRRDIEDYNKIFFDKLMDIDGCKNFDDVLNAFEGISENRAFLDNLNYSLNVRGESYISGELTLKKDGALMVFQYTSKAINDYHGIKIATIITFHDITEIQSLYRDYEDKKAELIIARSKLEEHIAMIQMLSIEMENNKLMNEVHDTMGHSMAELLALLEKCDILLSKDDADLDMAIEAVTHTLEVARESLAEIRRSVSKFRKMGLEK